MIHTASLVHDDVLDDCDTRRGTPLPTRPASDVAAPADRRPPAGAETVNSLYGTRVAVLAGDFLFAQSSWFLANLDNLEVGSGGSGG